MACWLGLAWNCIRAIRMQSRKGNRAIVWSNQKRGSWEEADQAAYGIVSDQPRLTTCRSKKIMCPFCEQKGHSIIEERNSIISYLVVALIVMIFGWYGLLLTPFALGTLRQHIHRCPKCLNAIKENSIFSSLEDNVTYLLSLLIS